MFSLQFGLSGWADTYWLGWLGWVRLVGSDWLGQILVLFYLPPQVSTVLSTAQVSTAPVNFPRCQYCPCCIALLNRPKYLYCPSQPVQMQIALLNQQPLQVGLGWVRYLYCPSQPAQAQIALLNRPKYLLPFSTAQIPILPFSTGTRYRYYLYRVMPGTYTSHIKHPRYQLPLSTSSCWVRLG